MIEINELTKYYGERKAVGPLSFSIADGEIVGLLGLNGAGKTTTLRVLACDLLPSSGTVKVDGLDVVDQPYDVRGRIGYLPDVPPLYSEMTVRDFLVFAARLRGMSAEDAEDRVPEVMEATQVESVADDTIASLSHGFKQRVGIAQAIVHRPKLLVLDEPISGLDPVQIVEMRELLRSLRGEHTILLSSHILSEISETCDRILVIRDGQIAASGTEAELFANLQTTFRIEVTVRHGGGDRGTDGVTDLVKGIGGVSAVEIIAATEPGDRVATLRVGANHDVREALCRALVENNVGLLEMRRTERELESVFLQLAGSTEQAKSREARRAARKAKQSAKKPNGGAPAESAPKGGEERSAS